MAKRSRPRRPWKQHSSKIKGWSTMLVGLAFIGALAVLAYVVFLGQGGNNPSRGPGTSSPEVGPPGSVSETLGRPRAPQVGQAATDERTNILVLGVDRREGERGQPTRSDSMMVVTVDRKARTAGLLSIPRDLYVSIPEWRNGAATGAVLEQKITTAHFWGDLWKYPGGGPALAAKTVEFNLGIPIDYYVSVDFSAFERAVDAIGGITIDVEKPLLDEKYPDDDGGVMTVYFPKGVQHMDGRRALQYARTRNPDSDFGRIHRQQEVMLAIRKKLLEPGTWPRLPSLAQAVYGSVTTNVPLPEVVALANLARSIEKDRIAVRAIDDKMVIARRAPDGAEVLVPKWDSVRAVIDEMFNGSPSG